jgi:hypothetical protein
MGTMSEFLRWCSIVALAAPAAACSSTGSNQAPPPGDDGGASGSDASDDGSRGDAAAGVGPDGGRIDTLLFAVVGDTRPPYIDDNGAYPTAIIQKIYKDVAALSPQPAFVISTGDYQFASTSGSSAAAQIDIYLSARAQFHGLEFPVMGNHECTGATDSNCIAGNPTANYQAFMSKMLAPIGKTQPYYALYFAASDGSWTAKFLFVAANAWNSAQGTWLDSAMAEQTTYTFIVRHEPANDNTAPGVTPSEQIMTKHPYTLAIVGHSHTFRQSGAREVIVGNGGAPPTGSVNYGFGLVRRQSDGKIHVDMIDYQSGQASLGFTVSP